MGIITQMKQVFNHIMPADDYCHYAELITLWVSPLVQIRIRIWLTFCWLFRSVKWIDQDFPVREW